MGRSTPNRHDRLPITSGTDRSHRNSPEATGDLMLQNFGMSGRYQRIPGVISGMKIRTDKERGATIVEAAIVYGLLFMTMFAVVEFGLAAKDWLSVSHASREGARAGATYGDDPRADIQILRDVERTLNPAGISDGMTVRIYEPPTGESTPTPTPRAPAVGAQFHLATLHSPVVVTGAPAPSPTVSTTWSRSGTRRTATSRRLITDRIAVEVHFTHNWLTGYFVAGR